VAREILTVAQMTAADRAAVASGTPIQVLMERAGEAVANAVRARYERQPVVVWCGPGDNGGDGYVAARHLKRRGWPVIVEAAYPPATEAARWAASRWKGEVRPLSSRPASGHVYIDALFGAGLSRPLEGEWRRWREPRGTRRSRSLRSIRRRAFTETPAERWGKWPSARR